MLSIHPPRVVALGFLIGESPKALSLATMQRAAAQGYGVVTKQQPIPSPGQPPAGSSIGGWANLGPDNIIRGWAIDKASVHRRLRASVLVDGVEIANLDAADFRGDVSFENKFCGFQTVLPSRYFDGEEHRLETIVQPQGAVLHSKTPAIRVPRSALPLLTVDQVEPALIKGRVIAPKVLRTDGLVLWPGNETGNERPQRTTWKEFTAGAHFFEVSLEGLSLAELLERGGSVSQQGDHALERAAFLWMPARFDWNWAGARCSLTVAGKIAVPDGCAALVEIRQPSEGGRPVEVATIELTFQDNAACFEAPKGFLDSGFQAILRPSRARNQNLSRSTLCGPNRSLLSNTDFAAWKNNRPVGWLISDADAVDRGSRTSDRHLPTGAATDTLILHLSQLEPGDVLISQRPRQLPASRSWRVGLVARSESPVLVECRLAAADGLVLHIAEIQVGAQWQLHRVETLAADMAVPALLEIRLKLNPAAKWIELDGLDFRIDDEKVFDLARSVSAFNLVQNPDGRGALGQTLLPETCIEIADGWFVDGFGKGALTAAAVPISPLDSEASADARAIAISSTGAAERGRLEIRLNKTDLAKSWLVLSFSALAKGVGGDVAEPPADVSRWRLIDRIALLKRKSGTQAGVVMQTVARRVLVREERTCFAIHFYVDDFDTRLDGEDIYLAFDFVGPFELTIDSVRLQHAEETPSGASVPQPFEFEDLGIALQIGQVRGCEHWLSHDRVTVSAGDLESDSAS